MRKQLRECNSRLEIIQRLKTNAGILNENKTRSEEEFNIDDITLEDLTRIIRSEINQYMHEALEEPAPEDDDIDFELEEILRELDLQLNN